MKKNLLLLFVCLFGALGGVKAYNFATPEVGKTYYLLNPEYNQFWYAKGPSETVYHISADLSKATPVYLESISGSNYAFSFYVNGTKYFLHEDDGKVDWPTSSNTMDFGTTNHGYYFRNNPDVGGIRHRYMNADASESTVSFGREYDNNAKNHKSRSWQFIPVDDIANYLAEVVETNYVSGWERVTSVDMLKTNPENYFFSIFSADALGLMVDASSSNVENSRPYYKTATNPLTSSQYLFEIENYDGGFALKSCGLDKYFGNNSDSWNFQNLTEKEANCKLTITLNNGAFEIQSANADWVGRRYWGLYDYTGYTDGQKFAGNKNDAEKGSFLIYRKLKKNTDMTSLIANPSFETPTLGNDGTSNDLYGWTTNTAAQEHFISNKNASSRNFDGVDGNNLFNTWGSTDANGFYIEQTITNLPAGNYQLTCYVASDNDNTVRVALGSASKDITTVGGGTGVLATINLFKTSAGDATIRVSSNTWFKTDNFHLTLIDGMQDLTPVSGKMNIEVNALQITRVTAYNNEKTLENYNAAIAAIEAAEASVASYANITAVYNECNTKAAAKMTTDGQAAFNASIAVTKYDNGTWETSQEATAIAAINSAYINALKLYPNDNADLTECVTNAAVSEGADWGAVTNWSSTGEGFHLNNHSEEGNTDGSGMTTPFAEAWVGSGSLGNQDITHDEITGLKSGYYRVTVLTRVYNNANADMGGFKFFANDDETDLRSGATQIRWDANMRGLWKTASVVAEVTDGTLNFGFKVKNASAQWLSFKSTTLTYLGETYERPVTIDFTSAIYNPSFEMDYMAAWTYTSGYDTDRKASSSMSGAKGDYLFNTWDWDGKGYAISQTLSNMLPGYYNLSAVMASDNDVALRLMVGEDVVATSTATGATNGVETSGSFYFAGGNMAISADASGSWYKVDDFRLTYVGDASAEMSVKAEVKWATFCAPFDVAIPDGVTAYTCASVTDGKLDMVEVTTGAISANTPVILNAESGLPSTTFYGKKIANATDDLIAGGLLRGNVSASAKDITYTGNEYLLQMQNEKAGFYKMSNSKTYKVGYNRCYLVMDSKQGAREVFFFEDDATAISTLEAAKVEVGALKDGKYLIGNKVVLVKNGVKYSANGQKLN